MKIYISTRLHAGLCTIGNFLLLFNLLLNKVMVFTEPPLGQGEQYFPNNYCSQLSCTFEGNRHLKIYTINNLEKHFIEKIPFEEKNPPCSLIQQEMPYNYLYFLTGCEMN